MNFLFLLQVDKYITKLSIVLYVYVALDLENRLFLLYLTVFVATRAGAVKICSNPEF